MHTHKERKLAPVINYSLRNSEHTGKNVFWYSANFSYLVWAAKKNYPEVKIHSLSVWMLHCVYTHTVFLTVAGCFSKSVLPDCFHFVTEHQESCSLLLFFLTY